MSSRALAAARSRRAGEQAPPISGTRPGTSIHSQSAFAYNTPPQTSHARTARAVPQSQQQNGRGTLPQPPPNFKHMMQQQINNPAMSETSKKTSLPFSKLSISDAIGLITLRLGQVEQWIIDTNHENELEETNEKKSSNTLDPSALTALLNRIESLETQSHTFATTQQQTCVPEHFNQVMSEITSLKETILTMKDDLNNQNKITQNCNIANVKNAEQLLKVTRDLTETKDMLKALMVKYDTFVDYVDNKFKECDTTLYDYEIAMSELEKQIGMNVPKAERTEETQGDCEGEINVNIAENNKTEHSASSESVVVDLKNELKKINID